MRMRASQIVVLRHEHGVALKSVMHQQVAFAACILEKASPVETGMAGLCRAIFADIFEQVGKQWNHRATSCKWLSICKDWKSSILANLCKAEFQSSPLSGDRLM